MKRLVVAAVPIAVLIAVSCSEERERAPAAPNCIGTNCGGGPGPGTSGSGGDTGATADAPSSDAAFDVSDAGVLVTAIVRPLTSFTGNPDTATTFDTASLDVRAPRVGGMDVSATTADIEGKFTLSGVQPAFGAATYFQVWKMGQHRTLAAVNYSPGQTTPVNLPLFSSELAQSLWIATGTPTPYAATSSTVVVHVVNDRGERAPNVRAALAGNGQGPFYDDAGDVTVAARTQTGNRGTIVFVGITGAGSFPLRLTTPTRMYGTVNLTLASGAVTHATLVVE